MADLRNPYDQLSLHRLVVATLVGGILDGTYKTIEDAQIAIERSRQTSQSGARASIRRPQE